MDFFCKHEPILLHREVFQSKIEVLRKEGAASDDRFSLSIWKGCPSRKRSWCSLARSAARF